MSVNMFGCINTSLNGQVRVKNLLETYENYSTVQNLFKLEEKYRAFYIKPKHVSLLSTTLISIKSIFALEVFYLCTVSRSCEIFLTHSIVLRRTQTVSLFFEWLVVGTLNLYNCQYKIYPECSVFLSPEYVKLDDFCTGVAGQWNINH